MLSLEELQNSKAPIHGGGDPRNLTPEQFAAADTDGDGVVSAAEYHDSFFTTQRAPEEEEEEEGEEEEEEEVGPSPSPSPNPNTSPSPNPKPIPIPFPNPDPDPDPDPDPHPHPPSPSPSPQGEDEVVAEEGTGGDDRGGAAVR